MTQSFALQIGGGGFGAESAFFLQIGVIFAIFYFLVFLPMQRQKRAQQRMLQELKAGQMVVTTGGIVGTILKVEEDDTLIVRVKPDNVKLQFSRSAVSALVGDDAKKP